MQDGKTSRTNDCGEGTYVSLPENGSTKFTNFVQAATILQIPTGRSGHVSDRHVLDKKFMNLLHKRHRIASNDPDYERKIENRHVLEGLCKAQGPLKSLLTELSTFSPQF